MRAWLPLVLLRAPNGDHYLGHLAASRVDEVVDECSLVCWKLVGSWKKWMHSLAILVVVALTYATCGPMPQLWLRGLWLSSRVKHVLSRLRL